MSGALNPMVYVMMFVSQFVGLTYMTGWLVGDTQSVLYDAGVLVDSNIWGGLLLVSATMAQIGFIFRRKWLISSGGMVGFMIWLFAVISLVATEHYYILITVGLLHTIFHAYVYLATACDTLFKESPRRLTDKPAAS